MQQKLGLRGKHKQAWFAMSIQRASLLQVICCKCIMLFCTNADACCVSTITSEMTSLLTLAYTMYWHKLSLDVDHSTQLPQYNMCKKGKCVKKPGYCESNKHCKVCVTSAKCLELISTAQNPAKAFSKFVTLRAATLLCFCTSQMRVADKL